MSTLLTRPFHLLVPAAGTGTRTGAATPKQYAISGGKTILRHTLEKFLPMQGLKSVHVIIDEAHRDLYDAAAAGLNLAPPVIGGKTRKQSVANGLMALTNIAGENDLVLIHDAARPFVRPEDIGALLLALETTKAATLAAPVADTLVDTDYNRLDRDALRIVQTPQGFHFGTLQVAHEKFKDDENFTDDCGLVEALGEPIELVASSHENFKITTAGDMRMAEKLLGINMETRIGLGYDVHALEPSESGTIRLGGIDIAHTHKLSGHSDADVALHTLTDALLGAINEGDIGQIFPPSDMQWKGADSEIFLREAANRVTARGGRIIHCDLVLICEAPKIGPHREAMQTRIASILGISATRVSIKATTSEQLGFTGRREGIAAQAVATIQIPSS